MTLTLFPYWQGGDHGCWVFDDERTGLQAEAFVDSTSAMITRVVDAKAISGADQGFAMTFASEPFHGCDVQVTRVGKREASHRGLFHFDNSNWYEGDILGDHMVGWLFPALLLYFETAPDNLYVRCELLPPGVNPRWNPGPDDHPRRFVTASEDKSKRRRCTPFLNALRVVASHH
jgi:hypothetical protein